MTIHGLKKTGIINGKAAAGLTLRNTANYVEVLKPQASILLTFIGICASFVAGQGRLSLQFIPIVIAIFVASAGANGMTNYLDCGIDALMQRTRQRALPAKRINPPERVLPLTIGLVITGLVMAWWLHPLVFLSDLIGTVAAVVWRKRAICVFPQGVIASCAPVLMGWFAVRPAVNWEIVFLCALIASWVPLHVWSVMIAHRDDYLSAGLKFFPMSREVKDSVKVLLFLCFLVYGLSLALYFVGDFSWLYFAVANALGVMVIISSLRLVLSRAAHEAWRLYKLSTFPYLGILFLVLCLDIWLR